MLKMMTGIMAKLGLSPGLRLLSPVLRLLAFAGMVLFAWWITPSSAVLREFADTPQSFTSGCAVVLSIIAIVIGIVTTALVVEDNKWGTREATRRAPFLFWCCLTDDSETIAIWMILFYPGIAVVDFFVSLLVILALIANAALWLLEIMCRFLNIKVRGDR